MNKNSLKYVQQCHLRSLGGAIRESLLNGATHEHHHAQPHIPPHARLMPNVNREKIKTMNRSEDRILTTHVGSLVRPSALLEAAQAARNKPETVADYEKCLIDNVAAVVAKQAEIGIDIVSDGEFGRVGWANYILERITGFETRPDELRPVLWMGSDLERFADALEQDMPGCTTGRPTEACIGPITYKDTAEIDRDITNFKAALKGAALKGHDGEGFMTVVAPASTAYDGVNEFYDSEEDFVFAIAEALRAEYQAVYKSDLLLQVDDAVLANMYDALVRQNPARYQEWADLRVEALNHALKGIPEDQIRYHVCFGSWHVPHVSDAPLEDIVDLILKVKAGAYAIEAANPRHEHEWRVWEDRKLPSGKILIPGVITHHTITVEHPRLIADRIIRFAKLLGRENIIAGTDCGFAQLEDIQRVHADVVWAKFEALVEGARIASKELWT